MRSPLRLGRAAVTQSRRPRPAAAPAAGGDWRVPPCPCGWGREFEPRARSEGNEAE